jgi:diacylglycerol kinase (ATP)
MQSRIARLRDAAANSFRGFSHALGTETAVREELAVLCIALPLGLIVAPNALWYVAMIGVVLLVVTVELLNTGIEKLADHVTPEWNREIGIVKDIGSAAVFCALLLGAWVWGAALAFRLGLI